MIGYIYKYENTLNHKVYIGQTTDIVNRQSSHRSKSTFVKSKFYNAVRKYGWDQFSFCILATIEADPNSITSILDNLEINYIKQYNSYSKGYNSTYGGHSNRGAKRGEEYKEYCRNRQYSLDTRKKMSESAKNRKVSNETRRKLKENALKRNFASYRELTTEKRNLGIRKALAKAVCQYTEDGQLIQEFETVRDAVKYLLQVIPKKLSFRGVENGIIRHCKNQSKNKMYYGFVWMYKSNV